MNTYKTQEIRHRAGGTRSVSGLMSLGIHPRVYYLLIRGSPPFGPCRPMIPFCTLFDVKIGPLFWTPLFGSPGATWRVKRQLWSPNGSRMTPKMEPKTIKKSNLDEHVIFVTPPM